MDDRLKKAISKGKEERETEERIAQEKKRREEADRATYLASFETKADKWVNDHLFTLIAQAEKAGRTSMDLPHTLEIPEEAIIKAIRKISGLRVYSEMVNYSDDYGRVEEWFVSWGQPAQTSLRDQYINERFRR